jgi:hypothetical protein
MPCALSVFMLGHIEVAFGDRLANVLISMFRVSPAEDGP